MDGAGVFGAPRRGAYGENIAEGYLRGLGYEILDRRFRCPGGELDIVALHEGVVVIVEVKLRRDMRDGSGAEAVDERKRRRIISAAGHYINRRGLHDSCVRFDVIEVYGRDFYDVNHIRNAFFAE